MRSVMVLVMATLVLVAPARAAAGWGTDWDAAFARAGSEKKLVFVDFYAAWCAPCRHMDEKVFPRPELQEVLGKFVLLRVDIDRGYRAALSRIRSVPVYVVYDAAEKERFRIEGAREAEELAGALREIASASAAFNEAAELEAEHRERESAMAAGHAYLRLGLADQARRAYAEARRAASAHRDAFGVRVARIHEAFTWTFERKAARSVKELRALAKSPTGDESDVIAHYFLGRAAEADGDVGLARDSYAQALELTKEENPASEAARERLRRLQ